MAWPSIFNKLAFFRTLNLFLIDQDFNVNQLRLVTKKELQKAEQYEIIMVLVIIAN